MADGRGRAEAAVGGASQAVKPRRPRSPWWVVGPAVAATAVVAAGFAVVFRAATTAATHALGGANVVAMIEAMPVWERLALPAAGGLVAGLISLQIARHRGSSGVGFVMEAIVLGRVRVPLTRSVVPSTVVSTDVNEAGSPATRAKFETPMI